uniref:Right handed beta helix domain-containing protein n=1 Tax=Candidatus Methanophagaceae archaeon ANME-1 ERB6 TaxID=2759912 RepID=A0A7G9YUH8_9EURY|nr:hypothetical protein IGDPAKFA_00016 [Methanosarcinales archaeon ANME-1 ERB6]
MSWYLNNSLLHTNESVREANYTLHAQYVGENNVSAVAKNANGTDMQTWVWNVTLNCTCGDTCVNETGWWRDGGAFIASNTPIQHAIDNATAGDTICVKDGTYTENVDVTKSHLTIRSENGPSVTTVSASLNPNKHVFDITDQTNVTLKGFEIRDAYGTSQSVAGIYMYNARECNISGNIVTNISATGYNCAYGIRLDASSDNNSFHTTTVYNLDANYYTYGIELYSSSDNSFHTTTVYNLDANSEAYGIYLSSSSNNNSFDTGTTVYNLDANDYAYGIELDYSSDNSFHTTTVYNLSADDGDTYGIWLDYSSDNSFHTTTVYNLDANSEAYGIYLYSSSDNNSFDTSTVYNLDANYRAYGIELYSSSDNSFHTSTVYNLSSANSEAYGIYLWSSSDNNSFDTSTVYNLSSAYDYAIGIYLRSSSGNSFDTSTVYDLFTDDYAYGIWLRSSSDNNSFSSGSISDINAPTWWDFCSDASSDGNSAENITISSIAITISFTYDNGIMLKSVETPPADPADKRNISKYVNAVEVTADSWIFMNVSYEEGDLGGVDENSLRMWKHNGTDWTEVPGTNGVNTAENYVYANITEFGSISRLLEILHLYCH